MKMSLNDYVLSRKGDILKSILEELKEPTYLATEFGGKKKFYLVPNGALSCGIVWLSYRKSKRIDAIVDEGRAISRNLANSCIGDIPKEKIDTFGSQNILACISQNMNINATFWRIVLDYIHSVGLDKSNKAYVHMHLD